MYIQIPRLDAPTTEGKFKQIEDILIALVQGNQRTIDYLQNEIDQLKGVK